MNLWRVFLWGEGLVGVVGVFFYMSFKRREQPLTKPSKTFKKTPSEPQNQTLKESLLERRW